MWTVPLSRFGRVSLRRMYEVDFTPNAADDLDRLDHIELCDVDDVLAALAEDPAGRAATG